MTQTSNLSGLRVGILGGGITGLTAAFYLLRSGADVTILEARSQVGGLATHFDFGAFSWDKFYHCILTSDRPLLQLIDDVGLSTELRWTETKVGFFARERLHSVTTSAEFLRFPVLTLWEKMRMGLGVLRATRVKDGKQLEQLLASEWLTEVFGSGNYQKMWAPLLKCKLGACREEASAAFIWATIARLYSTRDRDTSKKEWLGYVRGGYKTVLRELVSQIQAMGGRIVTGASADEVIAQPNQPLTVITRGQRYSFDHVISTLPSPALAAAAPQLSSEYLTKLQSVKYLGIVCGVLVLKRRLTPYYVTNLIEDLPFTGVIEMSNLIAAEETKGLHLVYLPKYTSPGDPLFEASEEQIWKQFWTSLRRVVPDVTEADVVKRFLFRERYVQPVPVLNYSDLVPPINTGIPGLLLANTTQIINDTLNNNAMVRIARRAVSHVVEGDGVAPAGRARRANASVSLSA